MYSRHHDQGSMGVIVVLSEAHMEDDWMQHMQHPHLTP